MKTVKNRKKEGILGFKEILFSSVVIGILILDLVTKYFAENYLAKNISLVFLQLSLVHNFGAGFGILQNQRWILVVISIAVLFIIGYYYKELQNKWEIVATGLITAGTLGNLLQRLLFGYVTDFIDFSFWPAFNIADSALSVGAGILIVLIVLKGKK